MIYLIKVILSLITLTYINAQTIGELPIDEDFYKESFALTRAILEKCPPQDCVPVLIGRSTTPIMAVMDTLGIEYSAIPLSRFRYFTKETWQLADSAFLPDSKKDELFKHFDNYLMQDKVLAGRRFMSVDYSVSGRSLFSVSSHLRSYLKARNRIPKLDLLHLFSSLTFKIFFNGVDDTAQKYQEEIYSKIDMNKYSVLDNFLSDEKIDQFAPYGLFDIMDSSPTVTFNHRYQELLDKFASYSLVHIETCRESIARLIR